MIKRIMFVGLLLMLATGAFAADERLRMSTTTSTENSGLLKVLLPPFEEQNNCKVDVVAVGTGKSLKIAEAGDADLVFVHARKLEDKFIADGFGVNRKDVMYNDFVIIGPVSDPAGIKETAKASEAFARIAGIQVSFISRGDASGTHHKERDIWQEAGVKPAGTWYVEAGQGMGEVIVMATEKRAYTLTDRGTYNAFKRDKTDLQILFEGEAGLFNPYGIIAVNPERHPHVKYDLAVRFIDYVTGSEGQNIIADYRVEGAPVFFIYGK